MKPPFDIPDPIGTGCVLLFMLIGFAVGLASCIGRMS